MKKSIIRKIEDLLSAMVNGVSDEDVKTIIRRPTVENKTAEHKNTKFPFKLIQIIR